MKHTRNIMKTKSEEFSCPAFESIEIPDYANDAELAIELEEEKNGIYGRLEESEQLADRAERMGDMTEYVEHCVNPANATTTNEVALIEQATAANLDGTGIEVEEVMPSMESYVNSTVSLEGFKDKIVSMFKAMGDLVSGAIKGFGDFMKATFTRLGALKKRIQETEAKVSGGEFAAEVTINKALAKRALSIGNDFINNPQQLLQEVEKLIKNIDNKAYGLSKLVIDEYDKFVEVVQTSGRNAGRGKDKDSLREALRVRLIGLFNHFQLTGDKIYGKEPVKELGGLYVRGNFGNTVDDLEDIRKKARETEVQIGAAGNTASSNVEFKGMNKASAVQIIRKLKTASGSMATFSRTNSMQNVDWAAGELDSLFTTIVDGSDTRKLYGQLYEISRMYSRLYVGPVSEYVSHFFKVANAELDLIEKCLA